MTYPRYPAYKPSGVPWLGDVPEHWGVPQLKYIARLTYGDSLAADVREDAGEVPVFGSNGIVGLHDVPNTLAPVIVVGRKGSYGKLNFSRVPSFCIDTTYFIDSRSCCHDLKWLFYALHPLDFDAVSQDTGVPGLSREHAHSSMIPVPPPAEQAAIAAYLDRETAQIDALIARLEQLVALLQEKRQALISHAVTKGLDPSAPMKESGVEWLGAVPSHWEVTKLGYLLSKIGSGKTPLGGAVRYVDEGVLFLRSQNVYDEGLYLDDVVFITHEVDAEMSTSRVNEGDVLLNITGASLGRTCIVPIGFPPANVNQHVCVLRLRETDRRAYVATWLKSSSAKSQMEAAQNGAAREGLPGVAIRQMILAIPPANEEANCIVVCVEGKTSRLNQLIEQQKIAVGLLRERRAALITAAVTGQIDVRGL